MHLPAETPEPQIRDVSAETFIQRCCVASSPARSTRRTVEVDATPAVQSQRTSVLAAHGLYTVVGAYDAKGVLHAQTIQRAKNGTTAWPVDR
jgi:hypothetical protein